MKHMQLQLMALAFGASFATCTAQTPVCQQLTEAVHLHWSRDSLTLSADLTDSMRVGKDKAMWVTPIIYKEWGDTLRLSPIVVRGTRNLRYMERARKYGTLKHTREASLQTADRQKAESGEACGTCRSEYVSGQPVVYEATIARKDAPWLWQSEVKLGALREQENCCHVADLPAWQWGQTIYVKPFVPKFASVPDNTGKAGELQRNNPVLQHISQYRPYDSTRILRKESGALYVHFPLDRTTLLHDFRGNAATLDRIISITRAIMADTTSMVRCIQIIGLASVEGREDHNRQLAQGRAAALQRYIQQQVPEAADSLFECVNGGEAWSELRSQIEDSQMEGRDDMLRIIDTEPDLALRERKLRQLNGGRPYAHLRTNLLSDQRNSGYLRIYYDYVPDHAAAVINAASRLLADGRYEEALRQLQPVRSDTRAFNAYGVALYMTGQHEEAMEYFRRSAAMGNEQAEQNLRQLSE